MKASIMKGIKKSGLLVLLVFIISQIQAQVSILQPINSTVWNQGSFVPIQFQNNGLTNIYIHSILIYKSNTLVSTIEVEESYIPGNSEFKIFLDPDLYIEGTDYKIKIFGKLTTSGLQTITSDNFEIQRPTNQILSVINPELNSRWYNGNTFLIEWASFDIGFVNIDYTTNGGTNWTNIASLITNTKNGVNSYSWTISPSEFNADYTNSMIRISNTFGTETATSNVFTFSMTPAAGENCANAIDLSSLVSPYTGTITDKNLDFSTLLINGYKDMIFYYDVEDKAKITITQKSNDFNSVSSMNFGPICPGTGGISYFDNNEFQPASWLNSTGNPQRIWYIISGKERTSGSFSLEWNYEPPVANKIIDIVYPVANSYLYNSQAYEIQWNSLDINSVDIEYSTDGGATRSTIVNNYICPFVGFNSYIWTIPPGTFTGNNSNSVIIISESGGAETLTSKIFTFSQSEKHTLTKPDVSSIWKYNDIVKFEFVNNTASDLFIDKISFYDNNNFVKDFTVEQSFPPGNGFYQMTIAPADFIPSKNYTTKVSYYDDNFDQSFVESATFEISNGKTEQTITFGTIPNKIIGAPAFTVSATATSGLSVSFSIASGPATISGNQITITGYGVVKVRASQAGNATYNPAPAVVQTFVVDRLSQTINFTSIPTKTYGDDPFTLTATSSSGLPVVFTLVSGLATISGNQVTITGGGDVKIRATQAGNSTYAPAPNVEKTFTVNKLNQFITFETIPDKIFGDNPFTLSAVSSSGLPVSFQISVGFGTLTGNTFTITEAGKIKIKASQSGNSNYNPATVVENSFTINKAQQTINIDNITDKLISDVPFTVTASANTGLPVSYEIASGPASITGNMITLNGNSGLVELIVRQVGTFDYLSAENHRTFTVKDPAKTDQIITFNQITDKSLIDSPLLLTASSSSNLDVSFQLISGPATISGNQLSLTGYGSVTVRAYQNGDVTYNPASAIEQTFKIAKANQIINFNNIPDIDYRDQFAVLTATATSNLPVEFSVVSGPATISNGKVYVGGLGIVKIKASQPGDDYYNPAVDVYKTFSVSRSQTITFTKIADKTFGYPAFPLFAVAESNLKVTFEIISGPAVVKGDSVTMTGAGEVRIRAIQTGNDNYLAAPPVEQTFIIKKASQTISFDDIPDKNISDVPFEVNAVSNSKLDVIFEIISGPAVVSGKLISLSGTPGIVEVKAIQPGNENYLEATAVTKQFEVLPLSGIQIVNKETISIFPNPVDENLHILFTETIKTNISIKIFDITGRLITGLNFSRINQNEPLIINTKNLKSTIYYMVVEYNGKKNNKVFVKN